MPKGSEYVKVLKATTSREDMDDIWTIDPHVLWTAIQDYLDQGWQVTVWQDRMLYSHFCECVKDYPDGYEE
jgi:hypothetical protein